MKLIFNSDILYELAAAKKIGDIPGYLINFFDEIKDFGIQIGLPLTTLLELERIQKENIRKEIREFRKWSEKLNYWGITDSIPDFSEEDLKRDIAAILGGHGVDIIILEPTLEDYNDAHRRACLKLEPHSSKSGGSDEMRDLVIWCMAIRIAKEEKSAMLMSKDEVHVGSHGNEEASQVDLFRAKTYNQALKYLKMETPANLQLKELLNPVWEELSKNGLSISTPTPPLKVAAEIFVRNEFGLSSVKGKFVFQKNISDDLLGDISITLNKDVIDSVTVENLQPSDTKGKISIKTDIKVDLQKLGLSDDDYDDRMSALQDLL